MEFFEYPPTWLFCIAWLAVVGALMLSVELGFRMGERAGRSGGPERGSYAGTLQGSMLGLMALLMAFTYSFSAERCEARKQAVIQEANALGTAYLRASLLPEPVRTELRDALRDYARTRIVPDNIAVDPVKLRAALDESEQAQERMWPLVEKLLSGRPPTPIDGLVVSSVNDVIDMHARRTAAARDRLPMVVFWMLALVAAVAVGVTGFGAGLAARRSWVLTLMLVLLVASVVMVIVDLDLPRSGFIRVSQRSLQDVALSME